MSAQPAILAPVPAAGHMLTLRLKTPQQGKDLLRALAALPIDVSVCIGFGWHFVNAVGAKIEGFRPFPSLSLPEASGGEVVPATQADVWIYVRGAAPDDALDRILAIYRCLPGGLERVEDVPTFFHRGGRDLSGYEDGTENPKDDAAAAAALVADGPLTGSSFVAAQRWVHDLTAFGALPRNEQDATIGRDRESNEELAGAPASAHVKRTAQESFEPPAFMLRRSMPYGTVGEHGLYFVAFGADLDRFERVLRRMVGETDGVVDALFRFSKPRTGGYYWCPPVKDGRLDLSAMLPAGVDGLPDVEVGG